MALFNQSIKTLPQIQAEIADSAGASADADMLTRAARSWAAAIEHFNNKVKWDFLLAEGVPTMVVAPFGITLTASGGQASASSAGASAFAVDDLFSGPGWILGTRVTATATNAIGLTTSATGFAAGLQQTSATGTRDMYTLPSDMKAMYSVRLQASQRPLHPLRRRIYDRSISSEYTVSTPERYDMFTFGGKGKIRLLPPPAASDVLQMRYYRRMSTTATPVDVPQDYEPYFIAWAKWHFLTDKGLTERATTWFALAQDGLKTMLADQTVQPDESIGFVPGHLGGMTSDNSTRFNSPDD